MSTCIYYFCFNEGADSQNWHIKYYNIHNGTGNNIRSFYQIENIKKGFVNHMLFAVFRQVMSYKLG